MAGYTPASGTTGESGGGVTVTASPGGLDPGKSPFSGSLTFTIPDGSGAPVSVPVKLNLVCG